MRSTKRLREALKWGHLASREVLQVPVLRSFHVLQLPLMPLISREGGNSDTLPVVECNMGNGPEEGLELEFIRRANLDGLQCLQRHTVQAD